MIVCYVIVFAYDSISYCSVLNLYIVSCILHNGWVLGYVCYNVIEYYISYVIDDDTSHKIIVYATTWYDMIWYGMIWYDMI